jgi:hypothetical protein
VTLVRSPTLMKIGRIQLKPVIPANEAAKPRRPSRDP